MGSFLTDLLGAEYTFTPYIPELVKPLNRNKGLILANLLTKLATFNPDNTVRRIYGKDYHFYYSKKDIAQKELAIDYSEFNKYINDLSQYVATFGGRQKGETDTGYNTTYFLLKLDEIKTLFAKGAEMLGKKVKKPPASKQKTPKSYAKGLPEMVDKALKSMNEIELKYQGGKISEDEYNLTIEPIKGLIMNKNIKITQNKENNVWQIKH